MLPVPPRLKFHGNTHAAKQFKRFALSQLEILKKQMSFQGLKQGVRRVSPFEGVLIECVSKFGLHVVNVFVAPSLIIRPTKQKYGLLLGNAELLDVCKKPFYPIYMVYHDQFKGHQIVFCEYSLIDGLQNFTSSENTNLNYESFISQIKFNDITIDYFDPLINDTKSVCVDILLTKELTHIYISINIIAGIPDCTKLNTSSDIMAAEENNTTIFIIKDEKDIFREIHKTVIIDTSTCINFNEDKTELYTCNLSCDEATGLVFISASLYKRTFIDGKHSWELIVNRVGTIDIDNTYVSGSHVDQNGFLYGIYTEVPSDVTANIYYKIQVGKKEDGQYVTSDFTIADLITITEPTETYMCRGTVVSSTGFEPIKATVVDLSGETGMSFTRSGKSTAYPVCHGTWPCQVFNGTNWVSGPCGGGAGGIPCPGSDCIATWYPFSNPSTRRGTFYYNTDHYFALDNTCPVRGFTYQATTVDITINFDAPEFSGKHIIETSSGTCEPAQWISGHGESETWWGDCIYVTSTINMSSKPGASGPDLSHAFGSNVIVKHNNQTYEKLVSEGSPQGRAEQSVAAIWPSCEPYDFIDAMHYYRDEYLTIWETQEECCTLYPIEKDQVKATKGFVSVSPSQVLLAGIIYQSPPNLDIHMAVLVNSIECADTIQNTLNCLPEKFGYIGFVC